MLQDKKNSNNSNEYTRSSVSILERMNFTSLVSVWLGYVFVVTTMQVGGIMGKGMTFKGVVLATLVSSIILTILSASMGIIATKTGMSFAMLSRYSFGKIGTLIPSLIVVVTTLGWFSIDTWLIGITTNVLFRQIPIIPIVILSGIGMSLTALYGIKWMSRLSDLAVPLITGFGILSIYLAVKNSGGLAGILHIAPSERISFARAVSLGVGSFAVGAVMFTPDVLRFAKSISQATWVMAIAMILGNSFMVLLGAVGTISTGNPDVACVLAAQGLLAPSFVVLVMNIWSTAQGCVYSGSLSIGNAIDINRKYLVIGFGIVGTILAILGFYSYFGSFINFLSSLVPPLAGIFLADFIIFYKGDYPENYQFPILRYSSFLSWSAGIAIFILVDFWLPVVNSVFSAFLVQAVGGYLEILRNKKSSQYNKLGFI